MRHTGEAEFNPRREIVTINLFVILVLFDVDKIISDKKRRSYRLLSAAVSCADRRQNCRNQSKNNKGPQYMTNSNTSPKKHKAIVINGIRILVNT